MTKTKTKVKEISIHSLRVEGDPSRLPTSAESDRFQSTPSVWRETILKDYDTAQTGISIHSLRVEGDNRNRRHRHVSGHFNPLPPCGGRPEYAAEVLLDFISIHSLRVEGDGGAFQKKLSLVYFNPLPPCGGRLFWI